MIIFTILCFCMLGAQALRSHVYGSGNVPVLVRSANCRGGEDKLIDCNVDANVMSCNSNQSAGVNCSSKGIDLFN